MTYPNTNPAEVTIHLHELGLWVEGRDKRDELSLIEAVSDITIPR